MEEKKSVWNRKIGSSTALIFYVFMLFAVINLSDFIDTLPNQYEEIARGLLIGLIGLFLVFLFIRMAKRIRHLKTKDVVDKVKR